MTTNGSCLDKLAFTLKKIGLDSLNVSLDTLNPQVFEAITGNRSIRNVIQGIDKALDCGIKVKINTTIMKGKNQGEILDLLDFAQKRGMVIRFLELMKLGHLERQFNELFYSEEEILKSLSQKYILQPLKRKKSATARYWITEEGQKLGIIANHSTPFCQDCNRLRLDSQGRLFGCLSVSQGISIKESLQRPIDLKSILDFALTQKQDYYPGRALSMKAIGG